MDKMPILFGVPDPQWHRNIIDHNKCLNVICTRLKWNHEYLGMFFKKFNYFLYLSVLLWTMLGQHSLTARSWISQTSGERRSRSAPNCSLQMVLKKMGLNPQIKQTTEKQKPLDSRQPILVNISMMRLQHNI